MGDAVHRLLQSGAKRATVTMIALSGQRGFDADQLRCRLELA
jgi:hypothetical protein